MTKIEKIFADYYPHVTLKKGVGEHSFIYETEFTDCDGEYICVYFDEKKATTVVDGFSLIQRDPITRVKIHDSCDTYVSFCKYGYNFENHKHYFSSGIIIDNENNVSQVASYISHDDMFIIKMIHKFISTLIEVNDYVKNRNGIENERIER